MKKLTLFLVLVIAVTSCKFIEKRGWFKKGADTLAVYQARMDSIRVADSINKVLEAERMIEQAKLDSIRAIEEAERERLSRFKYHIIVGSFKTPQYADDYSAKVREMGYNTQIIKAGTWNLVSAENYTSVREAINGLGLVRTNVTVNAWIYVTR